jgi:predicted outer membrane protein
MSFLRHGEIYRSDVFDWSGNGMDAVPGLIVCDEFPAGYSSADCSPAGSASASPTVHHFAIKSSCRSIVFHRTANSVLTACLSSWVHPTSKLTAKDQALVNRLSGLSGDAFDKAYIGAMVKEHETDIAEFEREANSGKDDDFKSFASKTLPTLKEHLQMAKDAASTIGAQL